MQNTRGIQRYSKIITVSYNVKHHMPNMDISNKWMGISDNYGLIIGINLSPLPCVCILVDKLFMFLAFNSVQLNYRGSIQS